MAGLLLLLMLMLMLMAIGMLLGKGMLVLMLMLMAIGMLLGKGMLVLVLMLMAIGMLLEKAGIRIPFQYKIVEAMISSLGNLRYCCTDPGYMKFLLLENLLENPLYIYSPQRKYRVESKDNKHRVLLL